MTWIEHTVETPLHESFRVAQVAGMFDVPAAERLCETFHAEAPPADDWRIGLIVGPSGSGKSTIARRLFGDYATAAPRWPEDRALLDAFPPMPTERLIGFLLSVGFGSPPAWIRPHATLSAGEQFRCDLAWRLAEAELRGATAVCDEFTSTVDRTVAKACAAAVSKAIRSGRIGCQLVAVTCHDDVAEWLTPDWIIDMADGRCVRGSLRRPPIRIEVVRGCRAAWPCFARHHYLSGSLSAFAECHLALWDGRMAAFCAVLALAGKPGRRRISRLVTLPDFQGLGIGTALLESVCREHREAGHRVSITAAHPAIVGHCRRSSRWRPTGVKPLGARHQGKLAAAGCSSFGRRIHSFEYGE